MERKELDLVAIQLGHNPKKYTGFRYIFDTPMELATVWMTFCLQFDTIGLISSRSSTAELNT